MRLSDAVAQRLLERIRSGAFRLGDRLMSERALAKYYRVSQATIREASRTLEAMGVVSISHGRGVFVEAITPNGVWGTRWMQWVLEHAPSLVELLEVREAVESKSAWLAARNATKRSQRKLAELLSRARLLLEQPSRDSVDEDFLQAYVELDRAFHQAIATAARNEFLSTFVEGLGQALQGAREATLAIPGRPWRSLEEHERIFKAIRHGDAEAARRAMEQHVRQVMEDVRSVKGFVKRRGRGA